MRERLSMQRAYRDAMETKVAKDNAEREEEEEMRKIMMAKFAGKKRRRERRITVAIVFREQDSLAIDSRKRHNSWRSNIHVI